MMYWNKFLLYILVNYFIKQLVIEIYYLHFLHTGCRTPRQFGWNDLAQHSWSTLDIPRFVYYLTLSFTPKMSMGSFRPRRIDLGLDPISPRRWQVSAVACMHA